MGQSFTQWTGKGCDCYCGKTIETISPCKRAIKKRKWDTGIFLAEETNAETKMWLNVLQ